jgi:hypothetical protein
MLGLERFNVDHESAVPDHANAALGSAPNRRSRERNSPIAAAKSAAAKSGHITGVKTSSA